MSNIFEVISRNLVKSNMREAYLIVNGLNSQYAGPELPTRQEFHCTIKKLHSDYVGPTTSHPNIQNNSYIDIDIDGHVVHCEILEIGVDDLGEKKYRVTFQKINSMHLFATTQQHINQLEESLELMGKQNSELEKLVHKMLQLLCGTEEELDEHLSGGVLHGGNI